jgi:membrane associated rhomboid family serine protease
MVIYGAKLAALIVYRAQGWRLITPIFLHAGIVHILSNVSIQLFVGGYLNLIYGNFQFCAIYLAAGIFGNMLSCIALPESVSVGSSGSVLGLLTSWVVWIIFRWNKIPVINRFNRNMQLIVVIICIVVTLSMSFSNYVDWAAHFGGTP